MHAIFTLIFFGKHSNGRGKKEISFVGHSTPFQWLQNSLSLLKVIHRQHLSNHVDTPKIMATYIIINLGVWLIAFKTNHRCRYLIETKSSGYCIPCYKFLAFIRYGIQVWFTVWVLLTSYETRQETLFRFRLKELPLQWRDEDHHRFLFMKMKQHNLFNLL